jgi:hypothetical protein
MAQYRFFTSTNPYSSRQTQGGGDAIADRFGWCAAASAIWASNMLVKGKKPGDSAPDIGLAGILQVKYRWNPAGGGQDVIELLGHVQLTGNYSDDMYRDGVLQKMAAEPGVYWFANDAHAMAVNTLARKPLWYDIEQGLFEYDSLDEMRDAIKGHYASGGRVWNCVRCART